MSVKSVLKGIGKVALKVAPIAAAFIPGVGPLASMAIGAGTGALSKKIEGGSAKDIAMSAGTGAAAGYGSGKAIGPSMSTANKIGSVIGGVNSGLGAAMSSSPNRTGPLTASSQAVPRQGGTAPGFSYGTNNPNLADSILAGRQNALKNQPFRSGYDVTQTNYNPSPLTTPNTTTIIGHMPKIYSDFDPRTIARNDRKKQQQQAAY